MGVGGQRHARAALLPGMTGSHCTVQEAGLASGAVRTGAENLTPPDPPARSESFYRLPFRGPRKITFSKISFG